VWELSGAGAWSALRDVAELAAAVPLLDADLAGRLPAAWVGARQQLADPVTHGLVRLAADELGTQLRGRGQEPGAGGRCPAGGRCGGTSGRARCRSCRSGAACGTRRPPRLAVGRHRGPAGASDAASQAGDQAVRPAAVTVTKTGLSPTGTDSAVSDRAQTVG
jgi:hypothetical protein